METIPGISTPTLQISHMFMHGGPVQTSKSNINSVICLLLGLKCENLLFRGRKQPHHMETEMTVRQAAFYHSIILHSCSKKALNKHQYAIKLVSSMKKQELGDKYWVRIDFFENKKEKRKEKYWWRRRGKKSEKSMWQCYKLCSKCIYRKAFTLPLIDLRPWVFWYFRSLEGSTSHKMPSSKYACSETVYSIIEKLEKELREIKSKEEQSLFSFSYICGNPVKLISPQFSQCVLQHTFHFTVAALARTIVKILQKMTIWIWSTYYWRWIQCQETKTNLLNQK